jgi:hypothetical protein
MEISRIGTNREHIMARLRWDISVSRAQGTRPEEVDSSRVEEVDSIWIVNGQTTRLGEDISVGRGTNTGKVVL